MFVDDLWKNADAVFESKGDCELALPLVTKFAGADVAYEQVLERGGIHAFSKALRLFGLTEHENAKNILWWNEPSTWKAEYHDFFTDAWAFAEDVFGNQFMFDHSGVVWLELETGRLRWLCRTFSEWVALVLKETDFYTGARFAQAWEEAHPDESLTGMYHLAPLTLFVCGGQYDIENLWRCAAHGHMAMNASIARQIKHLPNGTKIEITFED
jgi:hypothetical protein